MPSIRCPIPECTYVTDDVEASIAAALLIIHNNSHTSVGNISSPQAKQKPPKIDRPTLSKGSAEETWNTFLARWSLFKQGTQLNVSEVSNHLFQCCDEDLGNDILRGHPNAVNGPEIALLDVIKRLAVVPVAVSARRSELISMKQDHGENVRSFFAKINGKAATCSYSINCPSCSQSVDFTSEIVKDILITGVSDADIKRDLLGWAELDGKSMQETVSFIEAKEMARDALSKSFLSSSSISSYKTSNKSEDKRQAKVNCKSCKVEMNKLSWNKRQNKMIECSLCLPCWKKANPHKIKGANSNSQKQSSPEDEHNTISIGSVTMTSSPENVQIMSVVAKKVVLDHHIFTHSGWEEAESMLHPTLNLEIFTDKYDYDYVGAKFPDVSPTPVTVVTDTGAQSCLWGREYFLKTGFKLTDLLPVRRTLLAANQESIRIDGAIFVRLSGRDGNGKKHIAPVMVYVSPDTDKFFISRGALIQLKVISSDFPQVGDVLENATIFHTKSTCGCSTRTHPPKRPEKLPFKCTLDNNSKMKEWLLEKFSSSTFNKCTHQKLPGMSGPDLKLHVDPDATPVAVHCPSPVPLHWQDSVKKQIDDDVAMGVLEEVPMGEPTVWCHRMVLARKPDGGPRRTIDLSPLNRHCLRETHHVKPPFQQVSLVPPNTFKSVTDAWNGYHSVPIRQEDRHLTTFITPWGRYRYRVAPQGFLASGDAYSRRFDEIISSVQNKTKCTDDTLMWDHDLETHWWRMIDFLILLGRNGIVLNGHKFQFAKKVVDFAGFTISENEIRPQDKFLDAISKFPTPKSITDVRSWFGLVNQVNCYDKLNDVMLPFRRLLSTSSKFVWSDDLEDAFQQSKQTIINAIRHGIEIFDVQRYTCLRPDWSKTGIGFFLSQKHCDCLSSIPGCCQDGWKITLAGSRFLKPAETRYSPVEGEALAIAYSLEQTRHFTMGCDSLVVVTDHKPLTKLFGDRTLDEISNPRLFRLKQRTLLWRFSIVHMPGKENFFADATSRHPSETISLFENDDMENCLVALGKQDIANIRAVTWELVKQETSKDDELLKLMHIIESGFPLNINDLLPQLKKYWSYKDSIIIVDGVILLNSRILVPSSLRNEVLASLHAAHQGVAAMNEHAKVTVFWPGITGDIQSARDRCYHCNRSAPSQANLPPMEASIPSTPFELLACDFFHYKGWYYFVAADRLSGWTEQSRIKVGTNEAGASGLCKSLRSIFVTFGVPTEISSDGGPEFTSKETSDFLKRWGVHHRLSSAYHARSNGRAELAVKSTKRLLMDNINANGDLNNDKMVRALLIQRNTPDPISKLSPAQILFGRRLRDSLPLIKKDIMIFENPQVNEHWSGLWKAKENALMLQYKRNVENLNEHTKYLKPLNIGDHVLVQNQHGPFPKKWDNFGIIVEVKKFNQYLVKLAGSGRVSLRNRQFLKNYNPHNQEGPTLSLIPQESCPPTSFLNIPPSSTGHAFAETNQSGTSSFPNTQTATSVVESTDTSHSLPSDSQMTQQNDSLAPEILSPPSAPVSESQLSKRIRKTRLFYDAASGTYVNQNP